MGPNPALAFLRFVGVNMLAKRIKLEGIAVFRRLQVRMIALIAGLTAAAVLPVAARAQVNIDAGKTPAEIYASDCATCHKTPRGLAAGKNSLTLSTFLREHYTASRDQASALAAYVLGAGGAEAAPKPKPDIEHARAEEPRNSEPKPDQAKAGQPRTAEAKPGQPKSGVHGVRGAAKPEEQPASAATEDRRPAETANREPTQKPEEAAPAIPQPAPIVAAPAKTETPPPAAAAVTASAPAASSAAPAQARTEVKLPSLELGSSLNAVPPPEDRSSATEVPRDNIPD